MILENCSRFARILIPALTTTITLAAASVSAQSPTFVRTDHPSLGNNHVVADFNGDGKPDLAGQGAKAAAVLLGNGDGTFQARVEYPVADWTQDLAAGDFNRDGHVDLVVTINNPDIGLSLLLGNGDGTFDAAVNFPNTSHLDSPAVVATDLDNDGMLDVVIGHEIACWTAPCVVGRTISVMRGNVDGTFEPAREIDIGTTTAKIAVGDCALSREWHERVDGDPDRQRRRNVSAARDVPGASLSIEHRLRRAHRSGVEWRRQAGPRARNRRSQQWSRGLEKFHRQRSGPGSVSTRAGLPGEWCDRGATRYARLD
jgi:FG-GAP-like repeat